MPSPGDPKRHKSVEDAVAEAFEMTRKERSPRRNLLLILLVIVAVVAVRQLGLFGTGGEGMPARDVQLDRFNADLAALPLQPRLGNPDGSHRIVEFFDYRCPHCRRMAPELADLVGSDDQLDLVLVDLPVLGESSELAARYALAAALQDDYGPYHRALMFTAVDYTDEGLSQLGASLGLDPARLKADAHGAKVDAALQANRQLAATYGISATPTVLIGNQLYVGEIDKVSLAELLSSTSSRTYGD